MLTYFTVTFVDAVRIDALPGEFASVQVDDHVANRLHVVPSRLLPAAVVIDAHVADSARHHFPFLVDDMTAVLFLPKFAQAKICGRKRLKMNLTDLPIGPLTNHIDRAPLVAQRLAKQKVLRLGVPVDEATSVEELHQLDHLNHQLHSGSQRESPSTTFGHFLQTRPEHVHDQRVPLATRAEEEYVGQASVRAQLLVEAVLEWQLRLVHIVLLHLDCNAGVVLDVTSHVDATERTWSRMGMVKTNFGSTLGNTHRP